MFGYITRAYHELVGHKRCLACDAYYAKGSMREIWYRYTDNDVERTGAVHMCEPCAQQIVENVEEQILEDDLNFEIEVDDDDL